MPTNPLRALLDEGQSVWYDNIYRAMIHSGELAKMIREDGLRGITSNPSIFEKAIAGSKDYDSAIQEEMKQNPGQETRDLFFTLAIADIQAAADLLLPTYRAAVGHDGLISLEVSPDLAYDTKATVEEAKKLWKRVNRPNLMIKVPATKEGVPAVEQLISEGININVTLLFGVPRYVEVARAFIAGLESRQKRGQPVDQVASVASFFVSRVDTAVDKILATKGEKAKSLIGKTAIANAKMAYAAYEELFNQARFHALKQGGARPQRLLWASTGTKSADYSDVLYLDELIGPNTVTTVPPATYLAFKDHGAVKATLKKGLDEARKHLAELPAFGVDLTKITAQLEDEGVKAFAKSFENLLTALGSKKREMRSTAAA